jgi:hypothetical protein
MHQSIRSMNWFKVSAKATKHNTTLASHHIELKIQPDHQRKYISYPSKVVLAVRHQQPYIDQIPSRKPSAPLLPCYFCCIRSSCLYAAAISKLASPLHSATGKHSMCLPLQHHIRLPLVERVLAAHPSFTHTTTHQERFTSLNNTGNYCLTHKQDNKASTTGARSVFISCRRLVHYQSKRSLCIGLEPEPLERRGASGLIAARSKSQSLTSRWTSVAVTLSITDMA